METCSEKFPHPSRACLESAAVMTLTHTNTVITYSYYYTILKFQVLKKSNLTLLEKENAEAEQSVTALLVSVYLWLIFTRW